MPPEIKLIETEDGLVGRLDIEGKTYIATGRREDIISELKKELEKLIK